MTDAITLTGLEVVACHGVLPQEKVEPQRFLADVTVEADLRAAGSSDDLHQSISYADLAREIEAVLLGDSVDLIETLAERIATAMLAHPQVEAAEVTIRKPQAPAGVRFADQVAGGPSVRVRREQDRPVVIAAGANLGRRQQTIDAAVAALRDTPGLHVVAVADPVETDPVGGPDQPDYLNTVILARSRLAPWTILQRLHQIEAWHRRTRETHWGARTLDLDLIQVGDPGQDTDLVVDSPQLSLPHPRAAERAFVLVPWIQVDPGATLRVDTEAVPIVQLLAGVGTAGVRTVES